ncbi:hypothetical protein MASR2M15_13800 [Anaerolineales bacterium]
MTSDQERASQHFSSDENLKKRQEIHSKYSFPSFDFTHWVVDQIHLSGTELVLDIGCGRGTYHDILRNIFPHIRYVGLDYSLGMLKSHQYNNGRLVQSDAPKLPFADHSFDVVMANHMIYHLNDIESALEEFKRVLKPDGILVCATNSIHTTQELQILFRRAILVLTHEQASTVQAPPLISNRFSLENGVRLLSHIFPAVVRYDLPGMLVFNDTKPVVEYVDSTRSLREHLLPDDVSWEDAVMIFEQYVRQLIDHLGELEINKLSGVLISSSKGGFIKEFEKIKARVDA